MVFQRVDNTKAKPANVNRTSPYEGKAVVMVQSGSTIRIFPTAMEQLNLVKGSRVAIGIIGQDEAGKNIFGIAKTQHEDKTDGSANDGRKVDEVGKLSSAASSDLLGEGNVYELGESKTDDGLTIFTLNFVETVKLPKRKKVAAALDAGDEAKAEATLEGSDNTGAVANEPTTDGGQVNGVATSESDALNQGADIQPATEEEDEY